MPHKQVLCGFTVTEGRKEKDFIINGVDYLLTTRRLYPVKAKKLGDQCVLIFLHMVMIGWEHPQKHLQVEILISENLANSNESFPHQISFRY